MNKLRIKLSTLFLLMTVLSLAIFTVTVQTDEVKNSQNNLEDNQNPARILRLVDDLNKKAGKQQAKGFEKRAEMVKTLQEAVVGQKIDLEIAVTGSETRSNPQWTINGKKVTYYIVNYTNETSPSIGTKIPLTSQDFNNSSIGFYWIDGGENQVQYTATINGVSYSASATFDVKEPTVTVNTDTHKVTIYQSGQHQEILFGEVSNPSIAGIKFTRENFQLPTGFAGNTVWIQAVNYSYIRTLADSQTTQTSSDSGLDGKFPYSSNDPNAPDTADYPALCIRVCDDEPSVIKWETVFNGSMWLMFKPTNLPNGNSSIYVPLKKVDWNWISTATKGTNFLDILTNYSNSPDLQGIDTVDFP